MDDTNWRETLRELELALTRCGTAEWKPLFQLIHPTLLSFLHKDENLRSDKVDSVFQIYSMIFDKWEDTVEPHVGLEVLEELSAILFRLSCGSNASNPPWSCLSEECCLTLAMTMRAAICVYAKESSGAALYSTKNLPLLSHICSTLLEMSELASWRAVRLKALETLEVLFCPHSGNSRRNREFVAHFLPGLCQTLFRIVTGDPKIGSLVKKAAFDAWAVCLAAIFVQSEDSCSTGSSSSVPEMQTTPTLKQESLFSDEWYSTTVPKLQLLVQKTVDSFLHVQMTSDVIDGNRLSTAFTKWLSVLLSDCVPAIETKLAVPLRDTVVSGLVALAARNSLDESTEPGNVTESSCLAHEALMCFVKRTDVKLTGLSLPEALNGSRLLRKITMEAVSDQIKVLATQMPVSVDENIVQNRLRSIHGYLSLMDPESMSILASSRDLLHRFCSELADFLTLNIGCVEFFEEQPSTVYSSQAVSSHSSGRTNFPNIFAKSFQHFRDPKTLHMIQSVAASIASQDDTVDLFMETCRDVMLLSGGLHRNPCLLLMTAGLAGYLNNDSVPFEQRQLESIRILREYFETELSLALKQLSTYTQPPTVNRDDEEASVLRSLETIGITKDPDITNKVPEPKQQSVKTLKENTVTICLLLEMICVVSSFLGFNIARSKSEQNRTNFSDAVEDLLRLCLAPCFALASWSGLVGHSANLCLRQLAADCADSRVGELVTRNADYLISSITLQLHSVVLRCPATGTLNPDVLSGLQSACQTMTTLFEHATFEILPLLRPMVRQVLSCLDLTYEHHVDLFLPALKRLVLTCRQWHSVSQGLPVPAEFRSVEALEAKPVVKVEDPFPVIAERTLDSVKKLLSDTRRMHRIPVVEEPADLSEEEPAPDSTEPGSRVYPDQLHIVEEVMLRCIHLLATNDPKGRILSMEVLMEGCLTLRDEQDLLLPLVHKSWSPLMARFRDRFAIVVEKAFQFLVVLSNVAGDFLRSRATSDVIPSLLIFLKRGLGVSANATESYRHLTSYRVQHELLARLGMFTSDLNLDSQSLRPVVQLCALYLAGDQPPGLRQAALQSLKVIWPRDPGLVWFELLTRLSGHSPTEVLSSPPNLVHFSRIQLMSSPKESEHSGISSASFKEILSELSVTL